MVSMAYLKPLRALLKLVRVPPFNYFNSTRGFRYAVDPYGFGGIPQLPRGSSQVSKGPPFNKKKYLKHPLPLTGVVGRGPVRFKKQTIIIIKKN